MIRISAARLALLFALFSAGLLSSGVSAGPLYRWTDANGVVQFSDRPPPPAAPVKKQPTEIVVKPNDTPYNNEAEERWHAALRHHGVQIRTITIQTPAPTHSKPTGN